ncbi:hypothetical protein EIQ28_03750 [Xanthomonas campestris pv. plantaginis]
MRRSKEPCVIPLSGLPELPLLPLGVGWQDPVREYDYDRSEWQIFIVLPRASVNLMRVNKLGDQIFEVRAGTNYARCDTPVLVFDLAMTWACSRFS